MGPLFEFPANKAFGKSHDPYLPPRLYYRLFARNTTDIRATKCARLSARVPAPTVSASCKQGIFAKPRLVASTGTLFHAICLQQFCELQAARVLDTISISCKERHFWKAPTNSFHHDFISRYLPIAAVRVADPKCARPFVPVQGVFQLSANKAFCETSD